MNAEPSPRFPADLTQLRLAAHQAGYRPVPVSGPHMKVNSAGKRPLMADWHRIASNADEAEICRWATAEPNCTNTGILTGELVGLDIDVPVAGLAQQIDQMAEALLGPTPLHRIGKAPKTLRCYRAAAPMRKLETPELILPDGTKVQVEAMGDGQQIVAFGIHPATQQPYTWPEASPLDVPLAELPIVAETALRTFLAAAEAVLRQAGGLTEAEIKKRDQPPPAAQEQTTSSVVRPRAGAAGSEFFKAVNRRALDNIEPWFRALFPRAERQAGTGAWRVSSADLGRDLEEDISMHPRDGGQDFGTRKSCSPIDVVLEHGGAPTAQEAAFWLCDRLGVAPTDLGWKEPKKRQARAKAEANPRDLDGFDLTEDGVALAFTAKFHDRLRYCHHTGAWFEWTGTHWQREETKLAFSWARQTCRQLAREQGADAKVAAIMAKAGTAAAVERFAQADRAFAVTSAIWDRDPMLLGTPGGVVDLRSGELRQAMQGDFITKRTAVAPARETECPLWRKFLKEATGGDRELIRFLQQWAGYCLTGDTREHALLFVYGPGGNGKSVWLNTVSGILADYGRNAAMETFTASQTDKHPTDLAMLKGARMVCASETEEGRAWAEVRIKQLTGGDTITARFMRQDFFEFRPQFKLTVIGNHKPVLRNVDDAARRRFNVVPFPHKPAAPDKQLEAKLKAEWPGILRWMIDGCLDWLENGLIRPQVVVDATAEYFSEQDTLRQWVEECCETGKGREDTVESLFGSWQNYAKAHGEEVGSAKRFKQAMERLGFIPCRNPGNTRNRRGFKGIQVSVVPGEWTP